MATRLLKTEDYCTTTEAAEIVGVTDSYIRRLVRNDGIPHVSVGPRAVLIPRAAAEKMRDSTAKTGRPRSRHGRRSA